MNNKIYTISEYGLIGTDCEVESYNNFMSAKVDKDAYLELEEFTKTTSGKDVFKFAGNGKYIQAKNYVGTIQTCLGYTIEILPKIYTQDTKNRSKQIYLELLKLLYKLPNFKQVELANFENENMPILEIFIMMFLKEVGTIIKLGIKSDYINKEENLFYLKGKLLVNEQLKRNHNHKERFYVGHDDYNPNRAENKLIKSTLKYLLNLSKSYDNIRLLRLYQEHMYKVDFSSNIDYDFLSCKTKTRGMSHYNFALIWAKIFLIKESFSSFSGDTIAFSILYPMEKLFENYVEYWLNENELDIDEILPQVGEKVFVNDIDNKKLFGVKPDFLLKKNGSVKIVADAKWKIINNNNNFSQSDFYQLFAYKSIYSLSKHEDIELRLYYPMSEYLKDKVTYKYFDNSYIEVIPIDMNKLSGCLT